MQKNVDGPGGCARNMTSMTADKQKRENNRPVETHPASQETASKNQKTPRAEVGRETPDGTEQNPPSAVADPPASSKPADASASQAERPAGDEPDRLEGSGSPDAAGEAVGQAEPEPPDQLMLAKEQLAAAQAESEARYDLLLRERAELENFKRRMQRDKAEAVRFAAEPLLREVLPVVDNLERAVEHAKQSKEGPAAGQALVDGVELVLRSLFDVLQKHGVTRIGARGQPFDPSRHEAVAHVEDSEVAPNTILDEHQSGYRLHDRLLRPAMVSVAKAPPRENDEKPET